MSESIIEFIRKHIPLSDDEAEVILAQKLFKSYKKNEILLSEGEYAHACYFIIQGCLRTYYLKDGVEHNTDFHFENQTLRPISYQTKQASPNYIACLEDCLLAIGDEHRNNSLIEKIPQLSALVMRVDENLLLEKTLELDHFKSHSPEERYLMLLKNKPDYLNRIPLFHLASYLGITQISLSRIRKRISTK